MGDLYLVILFLTLQEDLNLYSVQMAEGAIFLKRWDSHFCFKKTVQVVNKYCKHINIMYQSTKCTQTVCIQKLCLQTIFQDLTSLTLRLLNIVNYTVAVLSQACSGLESWPIRADWAFQEGDLKETGTKTEHLDTGWIHVLQRWTVWECVCFFFKHLSL